MKNNEEFSRKSFLSKYEAIEFEFNRINDQQDLLHKLLLNSSNNLDQKVELLNTLNKEQTLNLKSWIIFDSLNRETAEIIQKNSNLNLDFKSSHKFQNNLITRTNDSIYWIKYDSLKINTNVNALYGFQINLMNLHNYFAGVSQNSQNYVFVFDKNGICIAHPDEKYIGENIFDFTSITPQDTIINNYSLGFSEHKAISEYLENTEITRFIKPLNFNGFQGYVAVGHLNFLIEENVNPTKQYVTIIFITTIVLISIIFVLFNFLTRKAYKEKAEMLNEKNALLVSNEIMNKENALHQLRQLKNQIHPHFLFNSLNTLYMIISIDKKKAQKFTMNLSRIYRYLIVPSNSNLVELKREIEFIKHYIDLLKERFQDELIFVINIENENILRKKIPYLALQLVVENAIKHNNATIETPLLIEIKIDSDFVIVNNTFQPKSKSTDNVHFGLEYLKNVYQFYKKNGFNTTVDKDKFICCLPLIED